MSKYPRYPAYKDSGVEWLGEVPEGWGLCSFLGMAKYINGHPFAPSDWSDQGLPIIRIAQLTGKDFDNFSTLEPSKEVLVKDGDLLFSWSATIDCFVWQRGPAYLNQHIFKVVPKSVVQKDYLFHLLKHVAPKMADLDAHGSTMRHIKKESLREKFILPPISEQTAIAAFLDRETARIDALVAKKTRFIELLKEKRQALITHAVTKGLDPNAKMKDSGVEWLGEVPEGWEVKPIKFMARFAGGGTPSRDIPEFWGGDIPWVSPKDMKSEEIRATEESITNLGLINSSSCVIAPGHILLVVRSGILRHTIPVARNVVRVAINQDLKAIRFDPANVNESYFLYFVQGLSSRLLLVWRKQGATVESIEQECLADAPLPVPPLEEQSRIIAFLRRETARIDLLVSKTERGIELLKEKRSALITAAVTGQIDVRQ